MVTLIKVKQKKSDGQTNIKKQHVYNRRTDFLIKIVELLFFYIVPNKIRNDITVFQTKKLFLT